MNSPAIFLAVSALEFAATTVGEEKTDFSYAHMAQRKGMQGTGSKRMYMDTRICIPTSILCEGFFRRLATHWMTGERE